MKKLLLLGTVAAVALAGCVGSEGVEGKYSVTAFGGTMWFTEDDGGRVIVLENQTEAMEMFDIGGDSQPDACSDYEGEAVVKYSGLRSVEDSPYGEVQVSWHATLDEVVSYEPYVCL